MPRVENATPFEILQVIVFAMSMIIGLILWRWFRKRFRQAQAAPETYRGGVVYQALGDWLQAAALWLAILCFGIASVLRAWWDPSEDWGNPIATFLSNTTALLMLLAMALPRLWSWIAATRGEEKTTAPAASAAGPPPVVADKVEVVTDTVEVVPRQEAAMGG